jgi:hypothetical protein
VTMLFRTSAGPNGGAETSENSGLGAARSSTKRQKADSLSPREPSAERNS